MIMIVLNSRARRRRRGEVKKEKKVKREEFQGRRRGMDQGSGSNPSLV